MQPSMKVVKRHLGRFAGRRRETDPGRGRARAGNGDRGNRVDRGRRGRRGDGRRCGTLRLQGGDDGRGNPGVAQINDFVGREGERRAGIADVGQDDFITLVGLREFDDIRKNHEPGGPGLARAIANRAAG